MSIERLWDQIEHDLGGSTRQYAIDDLLWLEAEREAR